MANQTEKKRLGPGFWVDEDDNLHASLPELLEYFDLAHTEENEEQMAALIKQVMDDHEIKTTIVRQDLCLYCGMVGMEHREECPLR